MALNRQTWLTAPNVSWRWAMVAATAWAVALAILSSGRIGDYFETRLAHPINFRARDLVGRSPASSPHLKVFGVDDSTFAYMGDWYIPWLTWAKVFESLAARAPRAIMIDQMFSKPYGSPAEVQEALERISRIKTPIIVAGFVRREQLANRQPLDTTGIDFRMAPLLGLAPNAEIPAGVLPPQALRDGWSAFGPVSELAGVVRHVGHINYEAETQNRFAPLLTLAPNTVIPHMALFATDDRRIDQQRLFVNGHVVPLDAAGLTPVNYLQREKFYKEVRRMKRLLQLAEAGSPADTVEMDDVILILPAYHTGNADRRPTAYGDEVGGFVLASAINSVLTGQWLRPVYGTELLIAAAALAGACAGVLLPALWYWTTLLAGLMLGVAAALALFSYQALLVPWLFPALAWIGAGVTVFAEKTRVGERKVHALRQALEGSVAPDDLKSILQHPERVALEARERVVTLVFIDVVGFSLLAENMLPRMAFENLKKMLSTISATIHQFGGVIDKTLGDGLLCYFGYRFDADSASPDHAEKALRCAIRIQRDNLARNLEAAAQGEPVYPLRIGINTSSCYLGDLGTTSRIDFTVVGNGVNFAKRLEGACEMHSVLMGSTTYDLVKGIGLENQAMTKRFIRIKHHSELVEAYEYDPFHIEPELRMAAIDGFRKCANIERIDHRWPVHDRSKIQLQCDFGDGYLVNFSHTGLSIQLPTLLAKGTRLNIMLDSAGGALRSLLAREGITVLQGEVRWGYGESGQFVHGIMVNNLSDAQSDALVQFLCEFAFVREAGKQGQDGRPGAGGKVA